MRQVEWVEEGAVGGEDASARGSVADLLVGGPYPCLSPPEVPPLRVANELLCGRGGSGMNGGRRCEPFVIDEAEYRELVRDLVGAHGFVVTEVPGWVSSRDDWRCPVPEILSVDQSMSWTAASTSRRTGLSKPGASTPA